MNAKLLKSLPWFFLVARFTLILTLSLEGLRDYGDFIHFYRLAGMGWPFLEIWVEFPPVFPFLSALLHNLTGDRQHAYDYLLVILFTLVDAANIALFVRLLRRLHSAGEGGVRAMMYLALLIGLGYSWWFFDSLAVFFMLLALVLFFDGSNTRTGLALAFGALTKLFPLLVLPAIWKARPLRQALQISIIAAGLTVLVYGTLYVASPQMTAASIRSQASKGSWETVWALLDGNFDTGNFGPEAERTDPQYARLLRGNPARLPSWLTLIPFAALGGWLWWKARLKSERSVLAFLGLTWCLFLLWSPGWSPQWVLFLLPIILLVLPEREALLLSLALVLINLLEWPLLLSRGYNWGLWLTVSIRTLLLVLLAVECWKVVRSEDSRNTLSSTELVEMN